MTDLATGLTDRFDVEVVTGLPNYHESDIDADVPRRETYEGVSVRRLRGTRFHKDRLLLRVVNWFTFGILVLVYLLRHGDRNETNLVLSNPPILPFATYLAKRVRGTQYAYLIYDMYPDMPVELGYLSENGMVARAWEYAIRHVYRDADRIVVLGESMERRLVEKMADDPGFDPEKVVQIANWEDDSFIEPMEKSENEFSREHDLRDKFTLLYSGNIGRYHDVGTAIDAIDELEDRGRDDIQLLVIGEGGRKEMYQERVREKNIENVRFLPFQPYERLPESLTSGDASLVTTDPGMEGICVSSKLYSSLAAGDPILALVSQTDEVARVVERSDSGAQIDQGKANEVADVLESWADNTSRVEEMGRNARECFESNYTKEHSVDAYANLFDEMKSRG
ncbi:glycosyltransferase family 4 protein [Halorubellus litoreus]|uniref:Glycosyltransferase family 4 protein n=1 Tax=Halorubellus litoreus TaxID=755308 RepID=A0ABD5VHJ8_9EURY